MNKPLAVFLDKASLYPDDLNLSKLENVASWQWFDNVNVSDIQHCLEDTEVVVSNKVFLGREIIQSSKQLKLICIAATGINNVDIEAARQHGIAVCNVRAYATSSVAQHVFSLILALNRKLISYRESVIHGDWSRSDFFCYFGEPISALEGKTLGIIGYGELGKAVAKIAQCFAMKVLIAKRDEADIRPGRSDLTTLLAESDVLSLHCPLTEHNYHMIAEKELLLMKSDAILINAARGGLIDEMALLHALKKNQIGGAALDVLEEEPPSVNNALINFQADNLIITPHIAWASQQSRQKLVNEIAKNIQAYQQGNLRNII
ncbi:MAG: D-2-hydroxyacid dehydrogenase [Gammaproteobacteria bacterium]